MTSQQLPIAAGYGGSVVDLIFDLPQLTDTGDSVDRDRLHLIDSAEELGD